MHTVILGIGNSLLQDDGAGIHAIRYLESADTGRDDITLVDGGTLSFNLATILGDADQFIVVDAARMDSRPGSVRVFVDDEMDLFIGSHRKASVHEVGLLDLMTVLRLTDAMPRRRALVGIEPRDMDWSETPSDEVARAIPEACARVLGLVEEWAA